MIFFSREIRDTVQDYYVIYIYICIVYLYTVHLCEVYAVKTKQ